jgi:hypothetical protein
LGLVPAERLILLPPGTDSVTAPDTTAPGVPWSGASALASAKQYRIKFSPDWVTGGFEYSSAYGFGGSTQLSLSDFLGNHRVYVATDFFSSLEETDFVGIYYYLPRRLDVGVGAFHYKSYYYSRTTTLGEEFSEEKYFSDRNYGFMLLASYPFGKFNRVDFDLTHLSVDREFFDYDTPLHARLVDLDHDQRMFAITFVGARCSGACSARSLARGGRCRTRRPSRRRERA